MKNSTIVSPMTVETSTNWPEMLTGMVKHNRWAADHTASWEGERRGTVERLPAETGDGEIDSKRLATQVCGGQREHPQGDYPGTELFPQLLVGQWQSRIGIDDRIASGQIMACHADNELSNARVVEQAPKQCFSSSLTVVSAIIVRQAQSATKRRETAVGHRRGGPV